MKQEINYRTYFDEYKKSVFQIEVDLRFWTHFLTISIDKYKLENPKNRWISQSGFGLFNIPANGLNGWLHSSKEVSSIEIKDLNEHSKKFFIWVMNLSIIRIYDSVETLLLQSIQNKFFPLLENPIKGKKETNKIIEEIKYNLKASGHTVDTKNNRHIISFLKKNSPECKSFLNLPIKIEWETNWETFYELFSVLRNIITHHGMMVSLNARNNLNSIASDVFIHYFDQPINKRETEILAPKDEQYFINFLNDINNLSANLVKFVADENDFIFIGLYKSNR